MYNYNGGTYTAHQSEITDGGGSCYNCGCSGRDGNSQIPLFRQRAASAKNTLIDKINDLNRVIARYNSCTGNISNSSNSNLVNSTVKSNGWVNDMVFAPRVEFSYNEDYQSKMNGEFAETSSSESSSNMFCTGDIDEQYKLSEEEIAVISVLLHYVLKSVYNVNIQTQKIRMSFDEMRGVIKVLYSKNQTICEGLRKLECVVGKGLFTGHFKTEKPNWDCLNLKHSPWFNAWQPNTLKTESVPEIFEIASKQAANLALQYSSELDAGWMLLHHFDVPFDNGNPKNRAFKQLN